MSFSIQKQWKSTKLDKARDRVKTTSELKPSSSSNLQKSNPTGSLVIPTGNNVNVNVAPSSFANESLMPKEPFKYDLVEHLRHIHAHLHILELL